MMIHGDQARITRPAVRGSSRSAIPWPLGMSAATCSWASAVCGSSGCRGSAVCPTPAWSAGYFHSFLGFQTNFRKSASVTIEKIAPQMSVKGQMGGKP